jgi:pimeloyl-ACP methyl ester carboxylesterase
VPAAATVELQPSARRVPGAHGLSLHLLEWSRDGTPLLLLHGFGHSARIWDPFVPDLATRYRTLALDARGHGDSDRDPEFRYNHAAVTRDVEAVVEHLGLERFVLVAHSMGGYASIRYSARHPERVLRLALVDAGPELSTRSRSARGAERAGVDRSFASPEAYAAVLARLYPGTEMPTLLHLARHWLRPRQDGGYEPKLDPTFLRPKSAADPENRRRFDRAAWAKQEEARLWDCVARIRCPTLVVRGERSNMLSEATQRRMVDEVLADGCSVTIPGAGHALMLDAPEALRAALGAFLL